MTFFWNLVSVFGGTIVLVGAAAWLLKRLVQHWLSKELDNHKAQLNTDIETHKGRLAQQSATAVEAIKFKFENELIVKRGQVDLFRDERRNWKESQAQREARLRAQIQRWANPILGSISDLEGRLSNILDHSGYAALSENQSHKPKQWSVTYEYFMGSTLYYFAQYFCWTRLLQHELSFELFQSTAEMDTFLENITEVGDELSRFPYATQPEGVTESDAHDKQVFRLQQRAIGELLLEKGANGEDVISYREFLDRWCNLDQSSFRRHLAPLVNFLDNLTPEAKLPWQRLTGMRKKLQDFRLTCKGILIPIAQMEDIQPS
jgi:hypothetical protein